MFRSLAAVAALVAGVALSSPAAAQKFAPAPTTVTYAGTGTLAVSGTSVNCVVRMTLNVNPVGTASVTNPRVDPGSPFCGLIVAAYAPWTIQVDPGLTSVTLAMGFSFNGTPTCFDLVSVPFTSGSPTSITFSSVTIAGIGSNPACVVNGTLSATGPLSLVP